MNIGRNFSNDELDLMLPFQQNGKFRSIECVTKSNVQDLGILIDSYVHQLNEKMTSYEITEMDCDYLISTASKNVETIKKYIEKLNVLNDSANKILVNYKFLKEQYNDILEILRNYSRSIEDHLNEAEIVNSIKNLEDIEEPDNNPWSDAEPAVIDERLFASTDIDKMTREDIEAECKEKKAGFLEAVKTASMETIERFVSDVKIMHDDIDEKVCDLCYDTSYKTNAIRYIYKLIDCLKDEIKETEKTPQLKHKDQKDAVHPMYHLRKTEFLRDKILYCKEIINDLDKGINDNRSTFYKLSEIRDYYRFIINNYGDKSTKEPTGIVDTPEDHPVISYIKNDTAVGSVDNLIDSYASLLKSVYSDQTKY